MLPLLLLQWKLWFGTHDSVDVWGLAPHWVSNRKMKYWHCSFVQYLCSLHRVGVKDWKLDSVVTTRVHQPISYLTPLTMFWGEGRGWLLFFLHHREWFILSAGSSRVWVLKGEPNKSSSCFHFNCVCHSSAVWVMGSESGCFGGCKHHIFSL